MKKILVLGGSGYIGNRLVAYLGERYATTSVDMGMFGISPCPTLVCDYDSLSVDFLHQFTHIILLAGHSCPSMCGNEITSCWENNVSNFVRLIGKLNPDTNLIYASTAAVYHRRNNPDIELGELDEVGIPSDIYTLSKNTIEQIANFRPNSVGLRFGTVGGFSQNFRLANFPNAISISAYRGNITISNPMKYRSILFMVDLCRAIDEIITKGIKSDIYNICSFSDRILSIGNQLASLVGCDISINDNMKTSYSFNCSSDSFKTDYNFEFEGTIEKIYTDIVENYSKIKINTHREYVKYG